MGILPPLSSVFLSHLETLILESYPGMTKALRTMRTNQLFLRTFRLRQENLDLPTSVELKAFLKSFTGLRHLSILIGKTYRIVNSSAIEVILREHMPTLRSMIWDYQDWSSLGYDGCKIMNLASSLSLFPTLEQFGCSLEDDSEEKLVHVSLLS